MNELTSSRTIALQHQSPFGLVSSETRGTTDLLDNKITLLLIEPDGSEATH